MWDKRVLEKLDCYTSTFTVSCQWKSLDDNFIWTGSGIYGPNLGGARGSFWDELNSIRSRWVTPWCLVFVWGLQHHSLSWRTIGVPKLQPGDVGFL